MKISLCLIARDEESNLAECVASCAALVDEVIVVDSGSVDATIQVAEELGCLVVERHWTDDFSAARNAAKEAASGDWILVLDADERLAAGGEQAIRNAMNDERVDALLLVHHDAASSGTSIQDVVSGITRKGTPQLLLRAMRNTPDLRWRGRVHETVDEWLRIRQSKVAAVPAHIVHYGAVDRARSGKVSRNVRLLRLRCAEDDGNPVGWFYLASELLAGGSLAEGWSAHERGWRALSQRLKGSGPSNGWVDGTTQRLMVQFSRGDIRGVAETLQQLEDWKATRPGIAAANEHPNLWFLEALFLEQVASGTSEPSQALARAAELYIRALDAQQRVFACRVEEGFTSWRAAQNLRRVLDRLGIVGGIAVEQLPIPTALPAPNQAVVSD